MSGHHPVFLIQLDWNRAQVGVFFFFKFHQEILICSPQ